jgi:hypothetical protein
MDNNNNIDSNQPLQLPVQVRRWTPSFEIVGLSGENNGRCCSLHVGCGKYLEVGDVCRVVATQVRIKDEVEDAIKLVKIADGTETCIVGYVPRAYMKNKQVLNALNKEVQVLELYDHSANTTKKANSKRNLGMASVIALNQIPHNG